MWYKRYGYKQPVMDGGIGYIPLTLIFLVMLVVGVVSSELAGNFWPFIVIVPLTIYFFHIVEIHALLEGKRWKEKRRKYHIERALDQSRQGLNKEALESIRRAKIYGDLPHELEEIDKEL